MRRHVAAAAPLLLQRPQSQLLPSVRSSHLSPFLLSRRWATSSPAAAHVQTPRALLDPELEGEDKGPFEHIRDDLESVAGHIEALVQRHDNLVMQRAAAYLLQHKGKMLRPAIVALSGYAAMPTEDRCRELHGSSMMEMMSGGTRDISDLAAHPFNKHLRLAEVTELVHTASLIHDDVLDESDTRRGNPSLHKVSGINLAVLAGDFLLARASNCLTTLGDLRVVASMAQALEDLTVGEVMQLEGCRTVESYLKKSFCKTSSLIAHSCRGAAILSDPDNQQVHEAVYLYGKHIGTAFQIVDDVLDFTATSEELGKPACNDLASGIATLPVFLAAERSPEMQQLIDRGFCMEGDVERALDIIRKTDAIEEAKVAARAVVEKAVDAISILPDTCAKESMIKLGDLVLSRRK